MKHRPSINDLTISREPVQDAGKHAKLINAIRDHRPLDLNAEQWRLAHPEGSFQQWRQLAHKCLLDGLHYDPGELDLNAELLERVDRNGYVLEHVRFNTTPWHRLDGCFLLPTGVEYPVPGIVLFHAWGGPILWGRHRVVDTGRDHPMLVDHRNKCYSGKWLADEYAKRGYAVIVIDNFHFGQRVPYGAEGVPEDFDAFELNCFDAADMDRHVRRALHQSLGQLFWAGTTWAGLNFGDDSRCIDYLQSRPEVDSERIGCTGLSGGAWRTNMTAALDRRIKASVSCCWMTTGDYQQLYRPGSSRGVFGMLPGVWNRMDVPDLPIIAAPNATMVISNRHDHLFCEEAQDECCRQIKAGYEWAGCPERFSFVNLPKLHCYDCELQQIAFEWFDRHLKRQ